MTSTPVPECPAIHDLLTTDLAVHLIIRIDHDWNAERAAATAEIEQKTQAATAFAGSPTFKTRYGTRIGVLRVQSATEVPSIVAHLLSEQGIELEQPTATAMDDAGDRPACSFCKRAQLSVEQASMTDSGWACPACFRAWTLKNQPQLAQKPRRLRVPPRLIVPILLLIAALFIVGAYYELGRLNSMNRTIRQHIPSQ